MPEDDHVIRGGATRDGLVAPSPAGSPTGVKVLVGHAEEPEAGRCGDPGSLDHYTRLVQRLLRVPTSLVSIVEAERQIFPGASGLVEELMSSRQTALAYSFCQYVVADEEPLVIDDARLDPRLRDNPAIEELDVIAYVGHPLIDGSGRTVGAVCALDSVPRVWTTDDVDILRDLALACSAELQRRQEIAEDGEQLARSILAATDIALAFYDASDHLVLANEPARRIAEVGEFRLDKSPYAGAHALRSDLRTAVLPHEQIIPRALSGELGSYELQWLGRPGKQIALSSSGHKVEHADGTPWGTLVAVIDVTELARALQVRDDLIATVSHELRTPLTSIRGYVEILADELEAAGSFVTNALATVNRAALSLQSRIDELLDVGVRQWTLHRESTDLVPLAQRVAASFANTAASDLVELTVQGEDSCPAYVDPPRFEQLLENLVSNALKFTGRYGHVAIVVRACEEQTIVEVVDDGVGMTQHEVSQAFDTFWRGEGARARAIQGFGVGLTVARGLVAAHEGSITVASELGRGTTVTVAIARSAASSGQSKAMPHGVTCTTLHGADAEGTGDPDPFGVPTTGADAADNVPFGRSHDA